MISLCRIGAPFAPALRSSASSVRRRSAATMVPAPGAPRVVRRAAAKPRLVATADPNHRVRRASPMQMIASGLGSTTPLAWRLPTNGPEGSTPTLPDAVLRHQHLALAPPDRHMRQRHRRQEPLAWLGLHNRDWRSTSVLRYFPPHRSFLRTVQPLKSLEISACSPSPGPSTFVCSRRGG